MCKPVCAIHFEPLLSVSVVLGTVVLVTKTQNRQGKPCQLTMIITTLEGTKIPVDRFPKTPNDCDIQAKNAGKPDSSSWFFSRLKALTVGHDKEGELTIHARCPVRRKVFINQADNNDA